MNNLEALTNLLIKEELVKGNSEVNKKLSKRAAQIINKAYDIAPKSTEVTEDALDFATLLGAPKQIEAPPQVTEGVPTSVKFEVSNPKPTKIVTPIEEQLKQVEEARRIPEPLPTQKPVIQEGQRAGASQQQTHFRQNVEKLTNQGDDIKRRAIREPISEPEEELADSGINSMFESQGVEAIDDSPAEAARLLAPAFATPESPISLQDQMIIDKALPHKLNEQRAVQGKGRTISRVS